jgi:hypothetical protein
MFLRNVSKLLPDYIPSEYSSLQVQVCSALNFRRSYCICFLHSLFLVLLACRLKGWYNGNGLDSVFCMPSFRISAVTLGILTEGFHGFPEPLQGNVGTISRLARGLHRPRFSNSSFSHHPTARRYILVVQLLPGRLQEDQDI